MEVFKEFIAAQKHVPIAKGSITCQSPSNIALVKYWGKRPVQIPENPSISFTLNACRTITTLQFEKLEKTSKDFQFEVFLEGIDQPSFRPKIASFFKRIIPYLPWLKDYSFVINTRNTFPHSSGIASSASGLSALAYCLVKLEQQATAPLTSDSELQKVSFLSRLGSGSACRSVSGPLMAWGQHAGLPNSSDLYAIKYPFEIAPVFESYHDTILLIDKGEKQVSSTVGHGLMHGHPFSEERFKQAHDNMNQLKIILEQGDLKGFIEVVESEALTLHAMMMTSLPYFVLMKPNTLEVIQKVWAYRKNNDSNVCFTLDAGANVHLLYPENERTSVQQFISTSLIAYCQNGQYICDKIGLGAKIL